jgi:hypothetical protein
MQKNTTLSEQFPNHIEKHVEKYNISAWFRNCSDSVVFFYMFFYMISELFWQWGIFLHVFLHDFGTVLTVWYCSTWFNHAEKHVEKYNTLRVVPKSCRKIPHCQNSSEIISKNTTLLAQFRNPVEKYRTVLTVGYFSTWLRNYSESVVFFYMLFCMILQLFWLEQFRNHVEKYHTVRTVPKSCRKTCRYFLHHFWQCSTSYIISELFWQCGIFLHDFGTAIMSKNTTLSEQFRNHVEKYHTLRTVQKSCRRISHCQNSSEIDFWTVLTV